MLYLMAHRRGLEPLTPCVTGKCADQLRQRCMVEMIGIEPIVTEVGGFTVRCHTITAAPP